MSPASPDIATPRPPLLPLLPCLLLPAVQTAFFLHYSLARRPETCKDTLESARRRRRWTVPRIRRLERCAEMTDSAASAHVSPRRLQRRRHLPAEDYRRRPDAIGIRHLQPLSPPLACPQSLSMHRGVTSSAPAPVARRRLRCTHSRESLPSAYQSPVRPVLCPPRLSRAHVYCSTPTTPPSPPCAHPRSIDDADVDGTVALRSCGSPAAECFGCGAKLTPGRPRVALLGAEAADCCGWSPPRRGNDAERWRWLCVDGAGVVGAVDDGCCGGAEVVESRALGAASSTSIGVCVDARSFSRRSLDWCRMRSRSRSRSRSRCSRSACRARCSSPGRTESTPASCSRPCQ